MAEKTAASKQKLLEPFVGKWQTTGEIRATKESPAVKVRGTDTYEWLSGGFFLIHRWDVKIGDEQHKGIEIIGYDEGKKAYLMHSFSDKGISEEMKAEVKDRKWKYTGKTVRFSGGFSKDGKIFSGLWEQPSNGKNWQPWMDINLKRVD